MLTREQERNLTTKQAIEYFCFKIKVVRNIAAYVLWSVLK